MILLDTHVVVWLTADRGRLSEPAAEAIRRTSRAGKQVAITGSTLWEIAMLTQRGRLRFESSLSAYLRHVESMFTVLPLTGEVAERSTTLGEIYPRDPTDQIIGATALVHGLELVTRDDAIRASGQVRCIW